MRVVIIGAGNVATIFGRLIAGAGHEILQVINRNKAHAEVLAKKLGCGFSDKLALVNPAADIYIVAISDNALMELSKSFPPTNKLLVHTAGTVSRDVLQGLSPGYGVLYPLQSLRKEDNSVMQEIPLLVDGNSGEAIALIEEFAVSLSSLVTRVNDEQRLKLHLAAVIVNNFTNYLYTLAAAYCTKEGLDFSMLLPLIEETALRLRHHHPADVQTGPAMRNDTLTLEKHLLGLENHPLLREFYQQFSSQIMEMYAGSKAGEAN